MIKNEVIAEVETPTDQTPKSRDYTKLQWLLMGWLLGHVFFPWIDPIARMILKV